MLLHRDVDQQLHCYTVTKIVGYTVMQFKILLKYL
jgi:hypothetical protein